MMHSYSKNDALLFHVFLKNIQNEQPNTFLFFKISYNEHNHNTREIKLLKVSFKTKT